MNYPEEKLTAAKRLVKVLSPGAEPTIEQLRRMLWLNQLRKKRRAKGDKKMIDITELVKRLRAPELWARHGRDGYWSDGTPFEAADALEAQAKEIAELKEMHRRDVDCIKRASIRISELEGRAKLKGERE